MSAEIAKSNAQSGPQRRRNKRKTVAVLRKAAREQLVSKGISGTSVQLIIEKAGVSRGALFHHFPTKNHLVAAAFDDLLVEAGADLQRLSVDLRVGRIGLDTFVEGLCEIFCSELFMGSMEIALNNRVEPIMADLIEESVAAWWRVLDAFWRDTFALPEGTKAEEDQHWAMAANLLRGHAFTSVYRASPDITDAFCAAFRRMILDGANVRPVTDSFAQLGQDIDGAIGCRLFTALAVRPPFVERVHTNQPDAFPLSGRKRLDASPWGAHVIEGGDIWLGRDAEDMKRMFPDHETIARIGCGSCINIPVLHKGATIGSLNILDAPNAYSDDHVARAMTFAARALPLFLAAAGGTNQED